MTIAQLSVACNVQQIYLRAVVSSVIASGLVKQNSDAFTLTKKGVRTAIYILVINNGMRYSTGDYRALMNALDKALESDAHA